MYLSFLKVSTFICYVSFYISLSNQLAVYKKFPVWNINTADVSQELVEKLFQHLNNEILPKAQSKRCEYSVLMDVHSTGSTNFVCSDVMFTVALKTNNLRTVSKDIYFERNHKRLQIYQIYKLRYSSFCRIVIGEEKQVSNLDDTPEMFSESDVFSTFYVLLLSIQKSLETQRHFNELFQKLRYIVFVSCNYFNHSSTQPILPNIFLSSFNWNRSPLISTSDPTTPLHIEYYQKTGKWEHFILASYHYVALKINATNDQILI